MEVGIKVGSKVVPQRNNTKDLQRREVAWLV